MEKVLKKEFRLSAKSRMSMAAMIILLLLISGCVFGWLRENIRAVVRHEAEKNVTNISELNADAVYRELANRQILLESIANSLSDGTEYNTYKLLEKMRFYADNYNFYNMGVLTPEGILYTTTEKIVDVSKDTEYTKALDGTPIISKSFLATDGGNRMVNLLTEPVYDNNHKLRFILTGTYRSADLAKSLNISALDGRGYSFLVDSDGEAVIYPRIGEDEKYLGLLKHINNSTDILPSAEGKKDSFFWYGGEQYYAHFEKIDINDWYFMTCVKAVDVFEGARIILDKVFTGMGILWSQIPVALSFLIYIYLRYQKKTQNIVFQDKLLKEKNFEYLRIYFEQITDQEKETLAFVVLDVDKFKEFNYIYGSKKGDYLLKYIYATYKKILPGDDIYRYTADQFSGLLHCRSENEAKQKIERFIKCVAEDIAGGEIQPFVLSIGICMLQGYDDIRMVYSDAMLAKNTVKGSHIQKYAFYDEEMRRERVRFMSMESAFQRGLRKGDFQVFYQPKFDMRNGRMIGAEALARWRQADGSMISPGEFIPCFERNGQIVMLDEFMLENVCRQMREMEEEGLEIQPVSVNLSRVQLKYPGITKKIGYMMKYFRISPEKLAIEITESALYDDNIPLQQIVSNIHDLGCKVNMDDYGTGLSSLSALANISFDVIKMDKSFIDKIGDKKMGSVLQSTIKLTADLGLDLIAEGVENKEQAEWLMSHGCNYAQGFYYAQPMSEKEYRRLLRNNHADMSRGYRAEKQCQL